MSFGSQIKDARVAHGLTQAELAVRAGISRPTVARVESGVDVSTALRHSAWFGEAGLSGLKR